MLAERIPVVSNDMFHEVGARMARNRRIATARRDVQGEEQPCGATEVHDVGDNGMPFQQHGTGKLDTDIVIAVVTKGYGVRGRERGVEPEWPARGEVLDVVLVWLLEAGRFIGSVCEKKRSSVMWEWGTNVGRHQAPSKTTKPAARVEVQQQRIFRIAYICLREL